MALGASASFGGCFVAFDGYELGDPNAGASGASLGGHSGSADAAGASSAKGGAGNDAGAPASEMAGSSSAGNGGASSAGNGGASSAGNGHGGGTGGGSSGRGGAGTGGATGSAGTGGGPGGSLVCAQTHGRLSIEIPLPSGTGFYCIDRAEVKNVEYQAFLAAQTGTSGQAPACAFNTNYDPGTTNGCNQYDPVNLPKVPVACVDWCDAAAYCKWEGKHLCGKIGGGTNAPAGFADANKSAWYRACSHAGDFDFPYGNTYADMKCIGVENSAIHPVSVPDIDCEGGYAGLYDMSGNVSEWEDSCAADAGGSDACLYRGGSYLDTNKQVQGAPSLQCNSNEHNAPLMATKPRNTRDKEIGFRCCSEPVPAP